MRNVSITRAHSPTFCMSMVLSNFVSSFHNFHLQLLRHEIVLVSGRMILEHSKDPIS
jgi:hypothetical protein